MYRSSISTDSGIIFDKDHMNMSFHGKQIGDI